MIEDRDILQANATIIGGLLIFFIFSLSVSLEQKIYGLNFMFGVSAIILFPFGNSIRHCIDERLEPARLWFKWGVVQYSNINESIITFSSMSLCVFFELLPSCKCFSAFLATEGSSNIHSRFV